MAKKETKKNSSSKGGSKGGQEKTGPIEFMKDAREELNKVSRPSKDEIVKTTMIVLFLMIFFAVLLALLDVVFHRLMEVVL